MSARTRREFAALRTATARLTSQREKSAQAREAAAAARVLVVRAGSALARAAIAGWRYLLTLMPVLRLGLLWARFCAATGLAMQRTRSDQFGGLYTTIHSVPRLGQYRVGPHGWTMRVRLRPGQHLDQYTAPSIPLRHTARAQAVKVLELPDQPGFLDLRILRRDPLIRVTERPRQLAPGRLVVGATESGESMVFDFNEHPHYIAIGATGSGKSMTLACLQAAIAPTDAVLVFWDLKFGIEAEAWRARYTEVATTQPEVLTSCGRVLWLAEQRAAILRRLGVRNIAEADQLGVHLRRAYVHIDEVAELAHDHDAEKIADKVLRELLRIVQLVRAMGIHVILCGQRFGSDLGKNITSIRAQVSGRVCLRMNDAQTAEMVLSGLASEDQKRALTMLRPGMAIVQTGPTWHYARCSYLTTVEIRVLAAAHADKRISWDQLVLADRAALDAHQQNDRKEAVR
jgi:S-DNA-T family DNA segregation ATPase FtsK/SpoIIIE